MPNFRKMREVGRWSTKNIKNKLAQGIEKNGKGKKGEREKAEEGKGGR
jgi:hypothetical protein